MQPTLLILAAGMGSRFGGDKQIESFGPSGETILEYSIFDAIRAGFGKVVFIIRKDFEKKFKEKFEPKLKGKIQTDYVFQHLYDFTDDFPIPSDRKKPWGTGHALLCARNIIHEPFAVINADDFYARDAFAKASQFLINDVSSSLYSIVGYDLENTLSPYGSVSRGVCDVDENNFLIAINERVKVYKTKEGKIVFEENSQVFQIPEQCKASMNFWCFHPTVFDITENYFKDFLRNNHHNPKAEFYIPLIGDMFIKEQKGKIKIIPTHAQWFGVTYKEDAPIVKESILQLVQENEYPAALWG